MFKNVASQKLIVFAWDVTTGLAKTGDAANLTAYRSLDYGSVTVLGDTSATEMDSTNAKGYYLFDLTQGETNGDCILFSCKSTTANISVVGVPAVVFTLPATGILAPATAGRTLVVDASGIADANAAKWLGGTIPAVNVTGVPKVDLAYSLGTAIQNSDFTIASATSTTVTLPTTYTDTTALPDDSRYASSVIAVVSGTGQGQIVILSTATGTARQYNVVSGTMPVQLDNTSKCVVLGTSLSRATLASVTVGTNLDKGNYTLEATFVPNVNVIQISGSTAPATNLSSTYGGLEIGTAQTGSSTTITLRSAASTSDNYYKDQVVYIISGTGGGQTNRISSYVGSTRIATVETTWVITPDNTSIYVVLGRVG